MSIKHIVLLAPPAWGHLRPLCVIAGRLASQTSDNIVVTLTTTPNMLDKVNAEIAEQFVGGATHKDFGRVRVVSLLSPGEMPQHPFKAVLAYSEAYEPVYRIMAKGDAIKCAATGHTFDAVPAPEVVVVDFFCFHAFLAQRKIDAESGRKVAMVSWITGAASTTWQLTQAFGDELTQEASRQGKPISELINELLTKTTGKVRNMPGIPPMYDYEAMPQKLAFDIPIGDVISAGINVLKGVDAHFICSSDSYEQEALQALRGSLKGPIYAIGPLLRPGYATSPLAVAGTEEFSAFLDDKLKRFGKDSVLFMSFGTAFWPADPAFIEEAIEGFIEKQFPFILTTASPFATMSSELEDKVKNSGIGLLVKWAPQQFILNHPAVGWFVSHCGHGSVMESLSSGVPLICWPFQADQPAAAAHISHNLRAGIELVQIRTGENGLKPLHPGRGFTKNPQGTREAAREEICEVIDDIRGEKGREIRVNVRRLQAEFGKAWEQNGPAEKEFQAFLNNFVRKA